MFEEALLAEQFSKLLAHEKEAERMYAGLAGSADDPAVRLEAEQFRRDKQRHVRLARRLLEIVQ